MKKKYDKTLITNKDSAKLKELEKYQAVVRAEVKEYNKTYLNFMAAMDKMQLDKSKMRIIETRFTDEQIKPIKEWLNSA